MSRQDFFPSKYLKVADLNGKTWKLTIKEAVAETMQDFKTKEQTKKPLLRFKGVDRGLILNATNYDKLADNLGDDFEKWIGVEVELLPVPNPYGEGDMIRLRIVTPPKPKAALKDKMSDEIPFN
jgi:hypothetical protein